MTDRGNLFGFVGFYKAMEKAGAKPICGLEIPLQTQSGGFADLVLLVRDQTGYRNLLKLVSRAYTDERFDGVPRLQRDWLKGHVEGLSALSCGRAGEVGRLLAGRADAKGGQAATESLQALRELFDGEFYLEVSRLGMSGEEDWLARTVELSVATGCPLVATNDVRFLDEEDFETHEARSCLAQKEVLTNRARERRYLPAQYFRSAEQMRELFADLPEAIDNAITLARRCNLQMDFDAMYMPASQVPKGREETEWMREKALEGLRDRVGADPGPEYLERLDFELGVIDRMGFNSYFLVVSEFVGWARDNGVTVGPGRGSGAGSLVSWVLRITDLDPLQHGLLFERFLNPERVSPPDLDIDFDPEGRGKVIDHVIELYGREAVAQIATLDFAQAKGAIRDAARVLGHPPGLAHRMCEQFPQDATQMSVQEAEQRLPQLKEIAESPDAREILDLASKLEGIPRNASRHAGGVVVAPGDLTNYVPLFRSAQEEWVATQFDKKDLEAVGLVKLDFLGLLTLAIIDRALELVNEQHDKEGKPPLTREQMSWDDPLPYKLLTRGETEALFQLESPRMRPLVQRFAPACFDDLVALLALIRPGPLEADMFDQAVRCRTGEEKMLPPHPLLAEVVSDTWGVMLYQEQVMEAARLLADYSYGEADQLRRAMGLKDREEMARHESIFVERATAKGIERKDAAKVFELMAHFAGYGFNKSHSAAYAVLSFQTAWLKAHYPACFMAATLTYEFRTTKRDRRWRLISACSKMALKVLPPDINLSQPGFSVQDSQNIRFGLSAIDGLGEAVAQRIVAEREQSGPYTDIYDLCLRAQLHNVDRRILDTLNDAGALVGLEPDQARIEASIDKARLYAEQCIRASEAGQAGLFGDDSTSQPAAPQGEEDRAAEGVGKLVTRPGFDARKTGAGTVSGPPPHRPLAAGADWQLRVQGRRSAQRLRLSVAAGSPAQPESGSRPKWFEKSGNTG